MIIQSGPAQAFFVEPEAQRVDQVQVGAGVGAEAYNVAGIRWYFRLIKDNMKHQIVSRLRGYR